MAGARGIVGRMDTHERTICHECRHEACNGSVGDCTTCARHGGPCAPWGAPVPRITMEQADRWIRALKEAQEDAPEALTL